MKRRSLPFALGVAALAALNLGTAQAAFICTPSQTITTASGARVTLRGYCHGVATWPAGALPVASTLRPTIGLRYQ